MLPSDRRGDAALSSNDPPEQPVLLTTAEVARLLRVSVSTVRRLALTGRMPPPVRVGRGVRWRRAAVLRALTLDR